MNDDSQLDDDEDIYDDLLAACDEALAAGATPPLPDDLEDSAHLKPRLTRGLACLQLLNALRPARDSARAEGSTWMTRDDVARTGRIPEALGRFQLRRELGRGGFGVVYLAYDPKMRRDVALKVPHAQSLATPILRQRFQREAHAAAALDHPNLVPVFECGEVGPIGYIASAYCPGPTLAAWLRDRNEPVPARLAAALCAALADAVAHAHARGVLHRDLKPSNILLFPSTSNQFSTGGLEFVPRVTDFGLARNFDASDADAPRDAEADHVTLSGVIVGTPTYMSPEQAAGRSSAVGPATDVYGLGVVLYELLAGRPPFVAESALDMLQQVRRDEPVSPRRLRARLPRDLETISLKCLQKEPRRRYASAALLADDLRRFLDGKPILARPVGRLQRGWRWVCREPKVAGLLALFLAALFGGFVGVLWQWQRAEGHATVARAERDAANLERAHAEGNFRKARVVVDRLAQLAEDLRHQPRLSKTRRLVLAEVSDFYQGFVAEKSTDPIVRFEAVKICNRLAELYNWLGQRDKEGEAVRRAAVLADGMIRQYPSNPDYRYERVICHVRTAHYLRAMNRFNEALAEYQSAIDSGEALIAEHPGNPNHDSILANAFVNWCSLRYDRTHAEEARRGCLRGIEIQRRLVDAYPKAAFYRIELAIGLDALSQFQWWDGRRAEAETTCRQALAMRLALVASQPDVSWNRELLARSQLRVASMLDQTGRPDAGEATYREAISTLTSLVTDFPDVPQYRVSLIGAWADLGALLRKSTRAPDEETALRMSAEISKQLVKDFPADETYQQLLGRRKYTLGVALRRFGKFAGATAALEDALSAAPNEPGYQNALAWYLATGPDAKPTDFPRSVELAKKVVAERPTHGPSWNTLGVAQYRVGHLTEALAALENSVRYRKGGDANDWFFVAMIRWKLGEKDLAREWFTKSVEWTDKNQPNDPDLRRFRAEAEAVVSSAAGC